MDDEVLEAAGVYDPAAPGAAGRRALLDYLQRLGATVEMLAEAEADGVLSGVSSQLAAFGPTERLTLAEVAQRAGTTPQKIRRLLLAEGLAVDESRRLPAFVVEDVAAFEAGMAVFGEEATLAFTRVMGASVARIVDAAISLFYGELSSTMSEGSSELEAAETNAVAGAAFGLLPGVVTHLLQMCFRANSVAAASTRSAAAGQTATVAVGFVDLVDSTRWAGGLSLKDHALALARFESAAWDLATGHGGRVVKLIGDEAMVVAPSAPTVCRIAVALCKAVADDAGLPLARAAVGFGDVTARGGDYVGPLVNTVARAVKEAAPGRVVVTGAVAEALRSAGASLGVSEVGARRLRGVAEPVVLYELSSAVTG